MDYKTLSEEYLNSLLWPKQWESGDPANLTIDQARSLAQNSFIAGLKAIPPVVEDRPNQNSEDELNDLLIDLISEARDYSEKTSATKNKIIALFEDRPKWVKAETQLPEMEMVVVLKDTSVPMYRMGNFYYNDEDGYNLFIQPNGAYESFTINQDKGFDSFEWLSEGQNT